MEPSGATSRIMDAGPKVTSPIMPVVPSESGNTGEGPPIRETGASSSTVAGPITQMSDPNIRATRDMPAQVPLMAMTGGPVNMSFMNMYEDDLLNLVYRNFDYRSITVQGGQARGTIVGRFTYGLNLLNPYAQTWARLHKRYNGRIRMTFSVSAVPLLKGNIIIGIMREMPPESQTTISIPSLQKINWAVLNLSGAGDYMFEVGDARQTKFYRNVSEDPVGSEPTDAALRPGIIMAIYTPIANQFGTPEADSSVVFNIRSQAINPTEDPAVGFYCYEPVDQTILSTSEKTSLSLMVSGSIPISAIVPVRSNMSMMVDGTKGQTYDLIATETENRNSSFSPLPGPVSDTNNMSPPYWQTVRSDFTWDGADCYVFGRLSMPSDNCSFETTTLQPQALTRAILQNPNAFVTIVGDNIDYLGYTQKNVNSGAYPAGFSIWRTLVSGTEQVVEGRPTYTVKHIFNIGWFELNVVRVSDIGLPAEKIISVIWDDNSTFVSDSAFSSAEGTLPLGFANLKLTDPSNVVVEGSLAGLPVYSADYQFVYALDTYFKLTGLYGPGLRVIDMIDTRTGSYIGTLGLFGSIDRMYAVVKIDPSLSSHYRINTDVQYIALTSPRLDSNLPMLDRINLISTEVSLDLQLSELRRSLMGLTRTNAMYKLDTSIQPNALVAGALIGGGLLSGLGSGLSAVGQHQTNITMSKLQQQYFRENQAALFGQQHSLQANLFGQENTLQSNSFQQQQKMLAQQFLNSYNLNAQKFGFQKDIMNLGLENRLRERGLSSFSRIPGNVARRPNPVPATAFKQRTSLYNQEMPLKFIKSANALEPVSVV